MKCLCATPCEMRKDLEKAGDKLDFLYMYCTPYEFGKTYLKRSKEEYKCTACLSNAVRWAAFDGELHLNDVQEAELEWLCIVCTYHYEAYESLYPLRKPTLPERLCKRWCTAVLCFFRQFFNE